MRVWIWMVIVGTLLVGKEQFCIVVNGEAIVTEDYENDIKVNIKPVFGYGFIAGEREDGFVAMIKKDETIGWIKSEDILCGAPMQTSAPYLEAQKLKTKQGKKGILFKKAFIVNTIFDTNEKLATMEKLPRYTSSKGSKTTGEQSALYEIYFVLQERDGRRLLAKEDSIFSDYYRDNKDGNIIGWVKKNHSELWKSRVAIEPKDNSLKAYLGENLDPRSKYTEGIEKPKDYKSLRYPLLEQDSKKIKISYMQHEKHYSDEREVLSKVSSQKSDYLVFLVDATAGMQSYMNNVKQGISDYLASSANAEMRIAIALYRDYGDKEEAFSVITGGFVSPRKAISYMVGNYFKAKSTNDNPDIVGEEQAYSEALFFGIDSVMKHRVLRMSDHPSARIIVIGDHGNHLDDPKGYTRASVAEVLGDTITLNAIAVHTDEHSRYVKRFREDIEGINRIRGNGTFVTDNIGSVGTIKKEIEKAIGEIIQNKRIVQKRIKGIKLTSQEKEFYKRNLGIDVENYGKIQQSVQLYLPKNKKQKYTKKLLVESEQVEAWATGYNKMAKVLSKFKNNEKALTNLKRELSEAIEALTGEEIAKDENIARFLEQNMGIPKSKILDMKFYTWVEKLLTDSTYRQEMIRIFREKGLKLKLLTEEKVLKSYKFNKNNEIEYQVKRDGRGMPIEKKSKFSIAVVNGATHASKSTSAKLWIWVPFEYLP